ncbi:GGDEF domain-containing protein [Pseudomonas protegens]|uniref:GGDEF domain-containing protein n=1 Tax=Pseudomonas protegens TaxID=380021 RepID=UPI003805E680
MPANLKLKLRPRLRRLLTPAVTRAELIGIAAWLLVLVIEPTMQINLFTLLMTVALAATCWYHHGVQSFTRWRALGVLYVFILTTGFSYVIGGNPALMILALPLAIALVLSSAILFVGLADYLLSAAVVWGISWSCWDLGFYGGEQLYLGVFCVAFICMGATLNFSYINSLRSVLSIESEFRELAHTDYLTSILNRRAFIESFEKLLSDGQAGYFMMLDIDSFKLKNDTYGHDVGDQILRSMAACLRRTKGSYSYGRIGGEEFGVLLLGHDCNAAMDYGVGLLEVIRNSLAETHPYTCSAGLARFTPCSEISAVLKEADKNMYMAKNNGKDCVFIQGVKIEARSIVVEVPGDS